MLLAIVSDTHRDFETVNKVLDKVKDKDYIIHLGDNVEDAIYIEKQLKSKNVIYVKGNCDYSKAIPSEQLIEIQGIKLFITHGHNYGVKHGLDELKERAKELGADIALYGHTHVPNITKEQGLWIINPGSATLPRVPGKTIAFIEIIDNKINPYLHQL